MEFVTDDNNTPTFPQCNAFLRINESIHAGFNLSQCIDARIGDALVARNLRFEKVGLSCDGQSDVEISLLVWMLDLEYSKSRTSRAFAVATAAAFPAFPLAISSPLLPP